MRTLEALDSLVTSGRFEEWFTAPKNKEEAKAVRYNFAKFLGEFTITHTPRDISGQYLVFPETRTLAGLHPLSWKEFWLAVAYMSCIVFNNPLTELTKDFLDKVCIHYGLEEEAYELSSLL